MRVLDVPSDRVHAALRERLAPLREQPSVADEVLAPRASWRVAKGTIDLGKIQAERALSILEEAMPARTRSEPGRAEALGNLLAGLASTATPAVARRARTLTQRLRSLPPAARRSRRWLPAVSCPARSFRFGGTGHTRSRPAACVRSRMRDSTPMPLPRSSFPCRCAKIPPASSPTSSGNLSRREPVGLPPRPAPGPAIANSLLAAIEPK